MHNLLIRAAPPDARARARGVDRDGVVDPGLAGDPVTDELANIGVGALDQETALNDAADDADDTWW